MKKVLKVIQAAMVQPLAILKVILRKIALLSLLVKTPPQAVPLHQVHNLPLVAPPVVLQVLRVVPLVVAHQVHPQAALHLLNNQKIRPLVQ